MTSAYTKLPLGIIRSKTLADVLEAFAEIYRADPTLLNRQLGLNENALASV